MNLAGFFGSLLGTQRCPPTLDVFEFASHPILKGAVSRVILDNLLSVRGSDVIGIIPVQEIGVDFPDEVFGVKPTFGKIREDILLREFAANHDDNLVEVLLAIGEFSSVPDSANPSCEVIARGFSPFFVCHHKGAVSSFAVCEFAHIAVFHIRCALAAEIPQIFQCSEGLGRRAVDRSTLQHHIEIVFRADDTETTCQLLA